MRQSVRSTVVVTGVALLAPGTTDPSQAVDCIFQGRSLLENVPNSVGACIDVAGRMHPDMVTGCRLRDEYGVQPRVIDCLDSANRMALEVGLKAMVDAGCISKASSFALSDSDQISTGVIFASSFPTMEATVQSGTCDRKWLFRQLVLANAQLAEVVKAQGPNVQLSASCVSTSLAIAMASDWLQLGRCARVVVIAADNVTSDLLLAPVSSGFRACGVVCSDHDPLSAARPFSVHRNGMILGAGAVGLVLEMSTSCRVRPKAELIGTHICNSAFHGCMMDVPHLSQQLDHFLRATLGSSVDLSAFCESTIYMSHETGTKGPNGCAAAEIGMLRKVFGAATSRLLITGTKAVTGHAMGVSFEDVISVLSLDQNRAPRLPTPEKDVDTTLLGELTLSRGDGAHQRSYVLHFSAGFGSQVTFLLYRKSTLEQ